MCSLLTAAATGPQATSPVHHIALAAHGHGKNPLFGQDVKVSVKHCLGLLILPANWSPVQPGLLATYYSGSVSKGRAIPA